VREGCAVLSGDADHDPTISSPRGSSLSTCATALRGPVREAAPAP